MRLHSSTLTLDATKIPHTAPLRTSCFVNSGDDVKLPVKQLADLMIGRVGGGV